MGASCMPSFPRQSLVGRVRIELTTIRLKVECSTAELPAHGAARVRAGRSGADLRAEAALRQGVNGSHEEPRALSPEGGSSMKRTLAVSALCGGALVALTSPAFGQ